MVHVLYDVNSTGNFFGQVLQHGEGGPTYYKGFRFQQGYGRGQHGKGVLGVVKKAWRFLAPYARQYVTPLAKKALNALTEEGLDAGEKIIADVRKGGTLKEAVTAQGAEAVDRVLKRTGAHLQGKQRGEGKKKKLSRDTFHLVGRSVLASSAKKGRRAQTLGLY